MFAALAIICEGKPGIIGSPFIAAPYVAAPYVAAQSSQVFARNYNGVYSSPIVAAPARLLSPYSASYAAPFAAPYAASYAAPYAAPFAAPYAYPQVSSPYIRSPYSPFY